LGNRAEKFSLSPPGFFPSINTIVLLAMPTLTDLPISVTPMPSHEQQAIVNSPTSRFGDRFFYLLALASAIAVVLLLLLVIGVQIRGSKLSFEAFGWSFLTTREWDPTPGSENYGALPFIYGTVVSSLLALVIAVPLSVGTAVFLTDLAPLKIRQPLVSIIEMLAAVPSVIWGLWGIFVMVPWLNSHLVPVLKSVLGFLPLFQGPCIGGSMLAGGMVIAIMILPIVTSVSREILRSVPDLQREAAYGLGATRWEVTRIAVLSYARRGLMGAAVLGLGRAVGETMAVTMVIGNVAQIKPSLFASGYTLASVIANVFAEASSDLQSSALFEIGLVLMGVTIIINIFALLLIKAFETPGSRRA